MGMEFQYRDYTRADGGKVQAADYIGSTKWQHALTKTGVDRETANNLFKYIDEHDYTAAAREAGFYTPTTNANPWGGGPQEVAPRQAGFYTTEKGQRIDPFAGFRVNAADSILNNKGQYRNVSVDGDYVSYQKKVVTPLTSNTASPFGGSALKKNLSGSAFAGGTKPTNKESWVTEKSRLLNNTLITDAAYNKLTDTQKQFYGLTPDQAAQQDSTLGAAFQGLDAAADYRRIRSAKGKTTGLRGIANTAVSVGLPALLGATLGPAGAAFGSGFNTLKDGGSLGDIAKSAGLSYFGTKALTGYGKAGSIWDKTGGGGTLPLGAAPTQAATAAASGGKVGILDSILGGAKNLFNSASSGISNLFSGSGGIGGLLSKGAGILSGVFGGSGGSGGSTLGNLLEGGLGYLQTREQGDQLKDNARAGSQIADPFQNYRPQFGSILANFMQNPGERISSLPGYQFRFDEGQRGLQRAMEASGLSQSGEHIAEAIKYGQGQAQSAYDSEFTKLAQLSGASNGQLGVAGGAINSLGQPLSNLYGDFGYSIGDILRRTLPGGAPTGGASTYSSGAGYGTPGISSTSSTSNWNIGNILAGYNAGAL